MADPTASATSADELLIPILIASNPGLKLDYKTMSALDGTKTAGSFEHRFRKYRARAQEILATRGGIGAILEDLVPVTPSKKRVKKSTGEGENEDGGDGEETPKKKARAPKSAKDPTTPDTAKKIHTTPKSLKTPTTPKAPKAPKTPKSPKAGKSGNAKVKKEAGAETEEAEDGNGEAPGAAKHAEMAAAGEELLQEMSFEFDGGSQVEDQA